MKMLIEISEIYQRRLKFTLIELLVTVSVMIILISVLLPALLNAKAAVRKSACSNNLRQFGIGNGMYVNDNNEYLPSSQTDYMLWDYLLMDYVNYDYNNRNTRKGFSIFHCPGGVPNLAFCNYRSRGYGYNAYITLSLYYNTYFDMQKLSGITNPSVTVLMTDYVFINDTEQYTVGRIADAMCVNASAASVYIAYRHLRQTNVLFADFHVKHCGKGSLSSYGGWRPSGAKWYNEGTVY